MRVMAFMLLLLATAMNVSAQYDNDRDRRYREAYGRTTAQEEIVNLRMDAPGTLQEIMPQDMINRVRLLHIEGPLNSSDLKYLKQLCNRSKCVDADNHRIDNYIDLELEHARIMSGSEPDVLHDELAGTDHLRLILLPEQLKRI